MKYETDIKTVIIQEYIAIQKMLNIWCQLYPALWSFLLIAKDWKGIYKNDRLYLYLGGRITGDILPPQWSEPDKMLQHVIFFLKGTIFRCHPDLTFAILSWLKVEKWDLVVRTASSKAHRSSHRQNWDWNSGLQAGEVVYFPTQHFALSLF